MSEIAYGLSSGAGRAPAGVAVTASVAVACPPRTSKNRVGERHSTSDKTLNLFTQVENADFTVAPRSRKSGASGRSGWPAVAT